MTGKPNTHVLGFDPEGERSRRLLEPLYGETETLSMKESSQYEAVRDAVCDWIGSPESPGVGSKGGAEEATERFLDRMVDPSPGVGILSPLGGAVWVRRRDASRGLAHTSSLSLAAGDEVSLPASSRAEFRWRDGSSILLKGGSRFIASPDEGMKGRLEVGRLYAWIEKQLGDVFRVATPLGAAIVVGTEFDLNLENPKEARLLVTRGRVDFTAATTANVAAATTVDPATTVSISKNRLLRCAAGEETKVERLSRREVRYETSWVPRSHPNQGRSILSVVAVLAITAAAFWGWRMYKPRGADSGAPPHNAVVLTKKNDNLSVPPLSALSSAGWKVHGESGKYKNGDYVKETESWTQSSVVEKTSEGGYRIATRIVDFKVHQSPDRARAAAGLIGREFDLLASPEGKTSDLRSRDSKPLEGPAAEFVMAIMATNNISWFHGKSSYTPGEQWKTSVDMNIPGLSESFIKIQAQHQFVGYSMRNGEEMGVVRTQFTLSLGGIVVQEIPTPQSLQQAVIDAINVEGESIYYIHPQYGRIDFCDSSSRVLDIKGHLRILVRGRSPVDQPLSGLSAPQEPGFFRCSYEYGP